MIYISTQKTKFKLKPSSQFSLATLHMRSYTAQTPPPSQLPPLPPPPPPPATAKSPSLPMLYYGLIVVGTAAIVLAMYNLIFIKWSGPRQPPSSPRNLRSNALAEAARSARSRSFENLDTFKYKKQKEGSVAQEVIVDECVVCLSVFEDGEEVRKMPSCKHSFHAPCIDMWLYSHSDCPLCRTTVPVVSWCHRELTSTTPEEEHSREVLLVSTSTGSLRV